MESTYRDSSRQASQLIFHQLSHHSNTWKDKMNGNDKYFSIGGGIDCQHGF
jgi:hypothetical protein